MHIMAKTHAATVAETTPDLSAKVSKAIDAIKKPFASYVKDFTSLAARREELAPQFMKAFGMWQAETAGTFVDFVRHLVPEIPATRAEYRSHRAYQAADYLRRLVGNAQRRPRTMAERQEAPAPPTDALSRILASFMPLLPDNQKAHLWEALESQLHWTPRQIQRVQTQVEHVDPLVEIRGRTIENLRVSIPEATPESKAA
jgi:hypothetical protein